MTSDDGEPIRRELIFYAPPGGDFAQPLATVARFPASTARRSISRTASRCTARSFCRRRRGAAVSEDPNITLPHLVLMSPLLRHHQRLPDELEIDGCPVEFLWVVPISRAELTVEEARRDERAARRVREQPAPLDLQPIAGATPELTLDDALTSIDQERRDAPLLDVSRAIRRGDAGCRRCCCPRTARWSRWSCRRADL